MDILIIEHGVQQYRWEETFLRGHGLLITIKGTNNGSIQDTTEWDTVERECDRILLSCALFLLVWYDVGVSVCKNTFQCHFLDILVLMAQQLWTESIIFYVCLNPDMIRKKTPAFRANLWSSLKNREDRYADVDFASYLVIQLTKAPLQVDRARV